MHHTRVVSNILFSQAKTLSFAMRNGLAGRYLCVKAAWPNVYIYSGLFMSGG